MSYGLEKWGLGGWGGADFAVTNHVPVDGVTGIQRAPMISFTIASQNGNINLSSINLTVNGNSSGMYALIINGVFTSYATGTINFSDPLNVIVTANIIHAFSPLEIVTVTVDAANTQNERPASGTTWQFTVNSDIHTFVNYIVRGFQRVFRVGS